MIFDCGEKLHGPRCGGGSFLPTAAETSSAGGTGKARWLWIGEELFRVATLVGADAKATGACKLWDCVICDGNQADRFPEFTLVVAEPRHELLPVLAPTLQLEYQLEVTQETGVGGARTSPPVPVALSGKQAADGDSVCLAELIGNENATTVEGALERIFIDLLLAEPHGVLR